MTPDGQDHYSSLSSVRLLTVWILFFQVLGDSPFIVWGVADRTGMPQWAVVVGWPYRINLDEIIGAEEGGS